MCRWLQFCFLPYILLVPLLPILRVVIAVTVIPSQQAAQSHPSAIIKDIHRSKDIKIYYAISFASSKLIVEEWKDEHCTKTIAPKTLQKEIKTLNFTP